MLGKKFSSRNFNVPEDLIGEASVTLLGGSLLLTSIGFYPMARNHSITHDEPQPDHLLLYCVSGEGWFRRHMDDEPHVLRSGECICLNAGESYAYGSSDTDPWSVCWVGFRGHVAPAYCRILSNVSGNDHLSFKRSNDRDQLFNEMFEMLCSGLTLERLLCISGMLQYYLSSFCFSHEWNDVDQSNVPMPDGVDRVIAFMKKNVGMRYAAGDFAAEAELSQTALCLNFKKKTGYSPIAYFNRLKIEQACVLLLTTKLKVYEISNRVGVDDVFYFSRMFTKQMGVAPREYRIRERNNPDNPYVHLSAEGSVPEDHEERME